MAARAVGGGRFHVLIMTSKTRRMAARHVLKKCSRRYETISRRFGQRLHQRRNTGRQFWQAGPCLMTDGAIIKLRQIVGHPDKAGVYKMGDGDGAFPGVRRNNVLMEIMGKNGGKFM